MPFTSYAAPESLGERGLCRHTRRIGVHASTICGECRSVPVGAVVVLVDTSRKPSATVALALAALALLPVARLPIALTVTFRVLRVPRCSEARLLDGRGTSGGDVCYVARYQLGVSQVPFSP